MNRPSIGAISLAGFRLAGRFTIQSFGVGDQIAVDGRRKIDGQLDGLTIRRTGNPGRIAALGVVPPGRRRKPWVCGVRSAAGDVLLAAGTKSVAPVRSLAPRQKAMLDFAVKVAERSHAIEDKDCEELKRHGFSDDDAWDIAAIAAMFAMSNRLANAFSIRPNDEFYAMGRERRD